MLERLYRWRRFDPDASLAAIRFLKRNTRAQWPDGLAAGPWALDGPNGESYFLNTMGMARSRNTPSASPDRFAYCEKK